MARSGLIRNWAEFVPAWAALQLLCWAPLPVARGLASALASAAYRLTPGWRRIARRNLEHSFPDWNAQRREAVVWGCYQNLGRNLLALARLPRLNRDNIGKWIDYEGFEHYEQAIEAGRGVLFLTAHLGAWELSSAAHALYGNPMSVMVRSLDNPLLDQLVDGRRRLFGNHTIRKQDSARDVLAALRANQAVGILADQNTVGDDGVFVEFLGNRARATKGVAQLAQRTGAAVIPGFAIWNQAASRYVLRFGPPVEIARSDDKEADLALNTQRCQFEIEQAVRRNPEQWLWIHRRWRTQPPGEPSIY